MTKQMEIRLSFYAKDLENLKGALDEKLRLELLEEAKKMTAEENEAQRAKTETEFRKDIERICKPVQWWKWDEEEREEWIAGQIRRLQSITYEVGDHYFEDIEFSLPKEWEVCGRCEGEGKHDPECFSDGWTQSEWEQEDHSFQSAYFEGQYDVECTECGGMRVTPEVKEKHLNDGQKFLLNLYYEDLNDQAYDNDIAAQERRMGA